MQHTSIVTDTPGPRQLVQLSDTPTTFSSIDMQMFHHYIMWAHPCIPLAYVDIWTKDVPLLSHQVSVPPHSQELHTLSTLYYNDANFQTQYPYLMHALLALAGSHSALKTPPASPLTTHSHRQKAITGLEAIFTSWPPKPEEAHVMLATSYLLCFQSGFVDDGFMEHVLSFRGCAFLSQLILTSDMPGPFTVQADMHRVFIHAQMNDFPALDQDLAREALTSLGNFAHFLKEPMEIALLASLVETVRPLLTSAPNYTTPKPPTSSPASTTPYGCFRIPSPSHDSPTLDIGIDWANITVTGSATPDPLRSFTALMASLMVLAQHPHEALLHLFDPSNQLGNIVMAHFLAVRFVVSPLSSQHTGIRVPVGAMAVWLERALDAVVDAEWEAYVVWPRKILACIQANVKRKRGLDFGDLLEMLVQDSGAFREGRVGKFVVV
jgi:hypothetical protein